jgi:hypothetical protein
VVCRDEQLVSTELCRPVEIHRINRLVRRQSDNTAHFLVDAGVDQILGADHVGLDAFDRVVFCSRYLFERCSVHDKFDSFQRAVKTLAVSDVADEVTQFRLRKALLHFELLELIARIDDDPGRPIIGKQPANKGLSERAGATCNQYGCAVQRKIWVHINRACSGEELAARISERNWMSQGFGGAQRSSPRSG